MQAHAADTQRLKMKITEDCTCQVKQFLLIKTVLQPSWGLATLYLQIQLFYHVYEEIFIQTEHAGR